MTAHHSIVLSAGFVIAVASAAAGTAAAGPNAELQAELAQSQAAWEVAKVHLDDTYRYSQSFGNPDYVDLVCLDVYARARELRTVGAA